MYFKRINLNKHKETAVSFREIRFSSALARRIILIRMNISGGCHPKSNAFPTVLCRFFITGSRSDSLKLPSNFTAAKKSVMCTFTI